MKAVRIVAIALALSSLLAGACAPAVQPPTPSPSPTSVPSATPRPEKNVALQKPVRVSASWVKDPPERAVNGNTGDWWGAGGPVPQWIEVDLGGLYPISRIRLINQGPTGAGTYRVLGRGADNLTRLLHEFPGNKSENQALEYTPDTPWQGISTVRVEIISGSGWVGLRELEVYSREEPEPLEAAASAAPPFLAGVKADALQAITADNAVLLQHLATFGRGTLNELTWSPDGKALAAAGSLGVWIYDAASLSAEPRLLEGHSRETLGVAFSQDGKLLYSASQDGTVKKWNADTGELTQTSGLFNDFKDEVGEQKRGPEVWALGFSPDRTRLATGRLDGTVLLWDVQAGKLVTLISGPHSGQIADIAFSPDGSLFASSDFKGTTFIWEAMKGTPRANLTGYQGYMRALAFSPDGKLLATGGSDKLIHVWDMATGKELSTLKGHTGVILSVAFSPDGQTVASNALDSTLRFWDVRSGKQRELQGEFFSATSLAFSPDGKKLAASSAYGMLSIWDTATAERTAGVIEHGSPITSIAFSPDDSLIAAGDEYGFVRAWDVRAHKLAALLLKRSSVTGMAFSPDGTLIAASGTDGSITVWDITSGKALASLTGHQSYVRCVTFSPDGKLIASGSTDKTVRLWSTATWKQVAILEGHAGEIESVAFSPDGAWLVSASSDKTVRAWDVEAAKPAGILGRHDSFALSAVFSADGSQVVSTGGDHTLRMWYVTKSVSGGLAGTLKFPSIGHGGWVTDAAFSPDGSLVASANVSTTSFAVAPGEIHLYAAGSGFPYALLRGHTKRVTSVAFSSDGKLLASGSADGSVRIWGTDVFVPPSEAAPLQSPTVAAPTATVQAPPPPSPTATPRAALPTSGNLALNQVVTASRGERARPASRAFDGNLDTDWGSGDFPPQWIQVDLGAPAAITQVRLLVTQNPNGRTVHRILAGLSESSLKEVHRFEGVTKSGQWLDVTFAEPLGNVQYVRIETLESPSWVGWVEVEVIGER